MSIVVFVLLMAICLGLIYLVHKYFGKEHFYLLGVIYSIVSFVLSFKLIRVFGVNINANLIFSSGLLLILYYFVNRYNERESRRFIYTVLLVSLVCILFLIFSSLCVPSIYDKVSILYRSLIFDNLAMVILYPVSLGITMFLSEYCFKELKKEDTKKNVKTILTLFGITFVDVALFIYFSYAIIVRYDIAVRIAIDNYLVKTFIMIIYTLIVNKLFMVRKVK